MSNARLSENFLALARDLDIMEPKVPEDIYKSHLEPTRMLMCFFPFERKKCVCGVCNAGGVLWADLHAAVFLAIQLS
jgi:hypothetical protein